MTNALTNSSSPYLQQHSDNPVNWYPWGQEALTKAKQENKPILLSIGYAACHWCHVMAHESFEDKETAQLMNDYFINIKVDREERPDLDKIYQSAHFLLTRQGGGWPLTIFLTPDLIPFFSGTYFPKSDRYQLPAFKKVLVTIADLYLKQREDIEKQNQTLIQILQSKPPLSNATLITDEPIKLAQERIEQIFDKKHGGFGQAPKFPQVPLLKFLSIYDPKAFQLTLESMAKSGLYDHIGGGFFRYCVDEKWQIPHFEKMLYDNGLLLDEYAKAYQETLIPLFKQVTNETSNWALTMQDCEGGFYGSLDADSEGKEGAYYVWDKKEIASLLTENEMQLANSFFGLNQPANFENKWHLRGFTQLETNLSSIKQKLLRARSLRPLPFLDKKILTSWNALMAKALFQSGRSLQQPEYIKAAEKNLNFIHHHLWKNNRLFTAVIDNKITILGYLDDYVFVIDALLTALEVRWDNKKLEFALDLLNVVFDQFSDANGGFYFTAKDQEKVLYRPIIWMDEATPAANGILLQILLKLGYLLGETRYIEASEQLLKAVWPMLVQYPLQHASILIGLKAFLKPPKLIILRGDETLLEEWRKKFNNEFMFAIPSTCENLPENLSSKKPQGKLCAYICEGTQCREDILVS